MDCPRLGTPQESRCLQQEFFDGDTLDSSYLESLFLKAVGFKEIDNEVGQIIYPNGLNQCSPIAKDGNHRKAGQSTQTLPHLCTLAQHDCGSHYRIAQPTLPDNLLRLFLRLSIIIMAFIGEAGCNRTHI